MKLSFNAHNAFAVRFRPQNVRARLTLWYVAVLAVVLLIYSAATSAVFFFHLRNQLDRLAVEDLETVEGFLTFDSSGRLFLRSDYHDHPYPAEQQERLMEVWSPEGELLYRNEVLGRRALGGPPEPGEGAGEGVSSYSERSVRLADGVRARVISKHHVVENRPTIIRLGFSEASLWQSFQESVLGLAAGLPLALGLAGLAGYFLARRALSPLDRMARRAHEINAERLDARLEVENPGDELGRLAVAFNETLARLEEAFDRLRRFTSDAAHELRTPLTAIRSVGEVGLQRDGSPEVSAEHYREVIGSMLEESGRLSHLVDSLLTLARADAGQIRQRKDAIAVVPLVREVSALLDTVAEEKNLRLEVQGAVPAQVTGDRAILRQVLVNLLDNAIKHSPPGTQVWVRVRGEGERNVAIEVEDSGPGIAAAHRDRIFDRFYRVDEGRSREDGGAGLGLSIAKWGVEAHGGRLELDCPDGRGCIFRLRLPAAIGSAETEPEAALRARVS
ncbi:MAG TPA: ATP-binding protein [Bryobacteraceae bacterium]